MVKACGRICADYEPLVCRRTTRWPYVCNGCPRPKSQRCRLVRYRYFPSIATAKAIKEKSVSRQGISLTDAELVEVDKLVSPLMRDNKMSVEAACKALADADEQLPISPQTLRRYIDRSRSSIIRLDLLSAPSRKARKKALPKVSRHLDDGRSYDEFEKLPDVIKDHTWEMDTVQGSKRDRCRLLTFCHRQSGFLIMLKIASATCECVTGIFEYLELLCDDAGMPFHEIFSTVLTDNGSEFADAEALEKSSLYEELGIKRCALYFCDPYSSWQKPHVENAHTFIRRVIPKGVSFESLTHAQVSLICSHINSYPRSTREKTPYDQLGECFDEQMLSELGIKRVSAKRVILSPHLLDLK
jgi:IS30 family transposase